MTRETLIQSQSQILQRFLYTASSSSSLNSSLFASDDFSPLYKNPRVKPDNDGIRVFINIFAISYTLPIPRQKKEWYNASYKQSINQNSQTLYLLFRNYKKDYSECP